MNVLISGFGMMGKTLLNEISQHEFIELVGVVDPLGEFGVTSFDDLLTTPDVIIDFSHPSVLNDLLNYATLNGSKLVIATTGYSDLQLKQIKDASKDIAILQTGNTSLGVNLLLEVLKQVTPVLEDTFDIEIIEKHHNQKVDAPSGTAKMFVDEIVKAKKTDSNIVNGRVGTSKRDINDITVHAVRGGTISGEHSIIFAGNDEIIEIKHQALSKKVFASGAIKAATFINEQENGLYSMKDVLFR